MTAVLAERFVPAASLTELRAAGRLVVHLDRHVLCLFADGDDVHAVDNRCPHMGFPLHRGTICDGILTCHWHHARFDLSTGGTFDQWADELRRFPVELDGDTVLVDLASARPPGRPPAHAPAGRARARHPAGARKGDDRARRGRPEQESRRSAPASNSAWPARRRLVPRPHDARLLHESGPTARSGGPVGRAVSRPRGGRVRLGHGPAALPARARFPGSNAEAARLASGSGTSSRCGTPRARNERSSRPFGAAPRRSELADMLFAAATDHRYLDGGHTLDFVNKALEALDIVGWDAAEAVLASLPAQLAGAERMEEANAWRNPVDLVALLEGRVRRARGGARRRLAAARSLERTRRARRDDPGG